VQSMISDERRVGPICV